MGRLREPSYLMTLVAVFVFGILSACSTAATYNSANDTAAVDALNTWWKEFTYSPPPVKAGAASPAQTVTSSNGRVYTIPRHVQTKQEAEEQAEDARFMGHKRALVQGFNVKGQTVTVITNLTRDPVDINDAQELCHNLGAFVWANDNRHFGLQDIRVTGADGELLSYRTGLSGKVR